MAELDVDSDPDIEAVEEGEAHLEGDTSPPPVIDPARELIITNLSVVEDPLRTTWPAGTPTGSQAMWTFGRLMEQMAGTMNPSQFVLEWLKQWEQDQTVNDYLVSARPAIRSLVIDPWLAASGGAQLNLRLAPFRLLAITNRIDLRSVATDGSMSAGEGRFVFGVLDPSGAPLPFTVIFEYGLCAKKPEDVKKWASDWHKLGSVPFGTAYSYELEKITKKFTKVGACSTKPNGSCLNQIRTNEVPLDPLKVWELREFRISPLTGNLVSSVTVQTPDSSLNGTAVLANFINANAAAAALRRHVVPTQLLGLSARATLTDFWTAPGILDNEARHGFALTTCNGCHTTETGTKFLHIKTRAAGAESALSAFLTGTTVADPVSGVSRTFNEIQNRVQDLQLVLTADNSAIF